MLLNLGLDGLDVVNDSCHCLIRTQDLVGFDLLPVFVARDKVRSNVIHVFVDERASLLRKYGEDFTSLDNDYLLNSSINRGCAGKSATNRSISAPITS